MRLLLLWLLRTVLAEPLCSQRCRLPAPPAARRLVQSHPMQPCLPLLRGRGRGRGRREGTCCGAGGGDGCVRARGWGISTGGVRLVVGGEGCCAGAAACLAMLGAVCAAACSRMPAARMLAVAGGHPAEEAPSIAHQGMQCIGDQEQASRRAPHPPAALHSPVSSSMALSRALKKKLV